MGRRKKAAVESTETQQEVTETHDLARHYTKRPIVQDEGPKCGHCGARFGHKRKRIHLNLPGMFWSAKCGSCEKSFMINRKLIPEMDLPIVD